MKQSIGYTVSLNIVIVFIVVIFCFIGGAISYYKAFKVNNAIADSIEKYEGYNDLSKKEIKRQLSSLGYNMSNVTCGSHKVGAFPGSTPTKTLIIGEGGNNGYCVYYNVVKCTKKGYSVDKTINGSKDPICKAEEYNYVIKTYLRFNLPIINQWLKFPVYTKTNNIYACYGNNC